MVEANHEKKTNRKSLPEAVKQDLSLPLVPCTNIEILNGLLKVQERAYAGAREQTPQKLRELHVRWRKRAKLLN